MTTPSPEPAGLGKHAGPFGPIKVLYRAERAVVRAFGGHWTDDREHS